MGFLETVFQRYLNYCKTAYTVLDIPLNRFIIFTGYYAIYLSFIIWAITKPIPPATADLGNPPIPPDPNDDLDYEDGNSGPDVLEALVKELENLDAMTGPNLAGALSDLPVP